MASGVNRVAKIKDRRLTRVRYSRFMINQRLFILSYDLYTGWLVMGFRLAFDGSHLLNKYLIQTG